MVGNLNPHALLPENSCPFNVHYLRKQIKTKSYYELGELFKYIFSLFKFYWLKKSYRNWKTMYVWDLFLLYLQDRILLHMGIYGQVAMFNLPTGL